MNAIQLLTLQHRVFEGLFERIDLATPSVRERLLEELADHLAVHVTIEEHHLYPAMRRADFDDVLSRSEREHDRIRAGLAALRAEGPGDAAFQRKLERLRAKVDAHIASDEAAVFPRSRQILDEDDLHDLGRRMRSEQRRLERGGHPRPALA